MNYSQEKISDELATCDAMVQSGMWHTARECLREAQRLIEIEINRPKIQTPKQESI